MKKLFFLLSFSFFSFTISFAQTEFDLTDAQSMLITGKGAGQDATINPYAGQDCFAIIKNIGESKFSIRIQEEGKIIGTISIFKSETKKIKLLKTHELYLDSDGDAKAIVDYEKIE